jgi:hypothetical protein
MYIFDPTAGPPRCVSNPNEIAHVSGVDLNGGASGTASSYLSTFRFLAPTPALPNLPVNPGTRWLRLTSFQTLAFANPAIPFDQQSVLTFWMRGEVGSSAGASGVCPGVPHSLNGPLLVHSGSAALGDTLTLEGSNLHAALCAILIGTVIDPGLPLGLVGGFPGSQLCVSAFATVPCLGQPTVSISLPIGMDPSINGLRFGAQLVDFDLNPVMPLALRFGTSDTILFTPGNF